MCACVHVTKLNYCIARSLINQLWMYPLTSKAFCSVVVLVGEEGLESRSTGVGEECGSTGSFAPSAPLTCFFTLLLALVEAEVLE